MIRLIRNKLIILNYRLNDKFIKIRITFIIIFRKCIKYKDKLFDLYSKILIY